MITMQIINSNGGAVEYAAANTTGIDIIDVIEPSIQNVDTLKANFSGLNVRHGYVGAELASAQKHADVMYINTARRNYTASESAVPIVDKNMVGTEGNGSLVMKNAFRLVSLQAPEMFIVETGLRIHTAASEAFAALPRYYIRQLVIKDARRCGYPMKKQKSFLIGTKRDFNLACTMHGMPFLRHFLEKGVDYGELPAYAVNRMKGLTKGFPSIVIDPDVDSVVPNITGHYAKDDSEVLVKDPATGDIRPFTAREISRLYGFPDTYIFAGTDKQKIRQVTDSIGTGFASFLAEDVVKHYFDDCYGKIAV